MAANSNLSTYTFAPWRMRNGQYVVASEATWRKPARLAVERGEIANTDFIDPKCRKNIRIVPVEAAS